jgi:hypothetical protein
MNNEYVSKDLSLTAYLMASGITIKSFQREDGVLFFCFDRTPQLEDLTKRYYSFTATVNPVAYSHALRTLKSIIYEKEITYENVSHI